VDTIFAYALRLFKVAPPAAYEKVVIQARFVHAVSMGKTRNDE